MDEGEGRSRLRLVRAPNPSALTGTGTNSWILGEGEVAVIDPGPALPAHLQAILAALVPGERVSAILVTHPHLDHSALAPALAERTGAPVMGFGPVGSGRSPLMARLVAAGLTSGGEGADGQFHPDIPLADGAEIGGAGWQARAIHTPGHMGEHLCFAAGDVLFSGDHVMGWSTSLVSPPDGDMGAYMASLTRLEARPWRRLLPGHGAPVEDPAARIGELAAHRHAREAQILAALEAGPATASALARHIYSATPAALMPAATRNTFAHLLDLWERNRIVTEDASQPEAIFALT